MFISRKLKENSISEYLLYMWQIEDLIRAYRFDIEQIENEYLSRFELDEAQQKEMIQWYTELIDMMRIEGVTEKGHLQLNKNTIIWLTDLHLRLLNSSKFAFYNAAYYKALPFVVELRQKKGESEEVSEIETCFEALYGVMLLKLQQKQISKETQQAVDDLSKLLSMLSAYYKQDKENTLELE